MNGKYSATIEIINEDSGEQVGKTIVGFVSLDHLEETFGKIEHWIEKYDLENFEDCAQCGRTTHIRDLSEPDDEDNDNLYCQDCLEDLMSGQQQVKTD